jgi:ribonuclease HII
MKHTGVETIDNSTAEWVLGSDEVGYGAWAGSLLVCSVLLPRTFNEPGVADSKTLSPARRRTAYDRWTKTTPIHYHLVEFTSQQIDELGVGEALIRAHQKALKALLPKAGPSCLIVVDGFQYGTYSLCIPGSIGLPKADNLIPSVSLASIIAKVTRDDMMVQAAQMYPGYGFAKNKGYGTPDHAEALKKLGPCPIHRRSYQPIKDLLEST